jgi:hypothetical protein
MAGVLSPLIAVGHHRSPLSLIRFALSRGNTATQGIWAILGCEMLIGHPISGISLDASASLLAAPEKVAFTLFAPKSYIRPHYYVLVRTWYWGGRGRPLLSPFVRFMHSGYRNRSSAENEFGESSASIVQACRGPVTDCACFRF